jgi:hypothetical protein
MAGTAVATLTPRARRANTSRWVEAKESGRTPHADIPMETLIDVGTHPTCPADVLPIPYRSNRSGPNRTRESSSHAPDLRSGGAHCSLTKDHGAHRICKGWSKDHALECATYTDQRPGQRKRRARWNAEDLHPNGQRSRQRNGARAGMLENYTRARVKETARARGNVGRTQHAQNKQTNKQMTT